MGDKDINVELKEDGKRTELLASLFQNPKLITSQLLQHSLPSNDQQSTPIIEDNNDVMNIETNLVPIFSWEKINVV